jgi:aspartate aminotransferase-like enzyme
LSLQGFLQLGASVRSMLSKLGFKSVAARGFEAPGVVVVYSEDEAMVKKLVGQGLQLAAGVPLMLDEAVPAAQRFRVGLFGIDKVYNLDRTVSILEKAVTAVMTGKDEL